MLHQIHDRREVLPADHMKQVASILELVHRVQHRKVQTQIKLAQARIGVRVRSDIRRHQHQTTIAMVNHI